LALKQAAFGRTREGDATPVDRDYHDAFLLIDAVGQDVIADLRVAAYEVRQRSRLAVATLASGDEGMAAAAREMVSLGSARSQRAAEAAVRRAALRFQRLLG
jgi:hypothetical protein